LLLLPVAVLAWWVYHRNTEPPEFSFAKVRREILVSTLATNGKVEPIEWREVRADTSGPIDRVPVHDGESVARGAVLAQLSATGLEAELTGAEARIEEARSNLANIERGGRVSELADIDNRLARARLERDAAQREYSSLKRLEEKQAATPADVVSAHARLRQSELEIEGLEKRRATLVGSNDKTVAEARLRDAQAAAALARSRIGQTVIRAPAAGQIYGLAVRPGAYVDAGGLITNVGRLDRLRVRVYVDEPELGRVVQGQAVTITWDALPGRKWTGSVEKRPSSVAPLGTRQVGEVLCTIENPGRDLIPGTNVNAEIRTNEVPGALTMPKEALRRNGPNQGVFVLRGDRVAWQNVSIGVTSITRAQVLNGLAEGDAVALPSDQPLHDGDAVKAVIQQI
jgi:HlyD family secretion protein